MDQDSPEVKGAPELLPRSALAHLLKAERAARRAAEQAEKWLRPLRSAAAEAVTTPSLDSVLRSALGAVADALGADEASVLLASEDGRSLVARAAVGPIKEIETELGIPAGEGFAGRVLASGQPLLVDDLDRFEVFSPSLRSSPIKSVAGVPLLAGGKVVGVLHAGSRQPGRMSSEDVAILEVVADPIAAAIDRVQLFEAERALRQAAELTAERLSALQRITAALASARGVTEVCQTIVDHAAGGAPLSEVEPAIWMLREGRLVLVVGGPRSAGYAEIPLDDSLPAAAHLATGTPMFVETRNELVARWPALAEVDTAAFAGFPLVVKGRRLGVMSIGYTSDHHFDDEERAYLTSVAEQAALALERAELAEIEEEAQHRGAFLAEASFALTNRYASPVQLLARLASLTVPRLADYCAVLLERGGRLERVAAADALADLPREAREEAERFAAANEWGAVRRTFETGEAVMLGGAGEPPLGAAGLGRIAAANYLTSAIVVPLDNHGRRVGALLLLACATHLPYRREDLEVAEALASRAGRIVEDLAARERERSLAEALTRALLPARLPRVAGLELVARYLPAEADGVGGDWYDAFELQDGRLGLVVGDVGGHGVEAASTMARLRNGLFAFASEGHPPAGVFERLSTMLGSDTGEWAMPDPIASLLFATLDRSSLVMHLTCAGHPPWIRLRGDEVSLTHCGGQILAAGLPAAPAESDHQLEEGDLCLFMTDGLVERVSEDLSVSLERLCDVLVMNRSRPLEELCDLLIEATAPPSGRSDDCCLVALHVVSCVEPP